MIKKAPVYTLLLSLLLISTFTPWRILAQGLPFVIFVISLIIWVEKIYNYI
jgi:hypothetical protein